MKHTASEFSRNKLFLDFLHKTLYVLIKREKQSAVFPFCKPFSSVQGTPFDGFPYGLRAAKHRAALRLSLHSRFKERSPLKIPLKGNYPFLVLCTGCRTDSAGRFSAAPSRGVLRGCGGTFLALGIPRWMSTYERGVFHGCGTLYGYSSFSFSSAFFGSSG